MASQRKTTVAVLRSELEIPIEQFAALIKKSVSAVTKIETGTLPLSKETAERIAAETGVAAEWLLAGDPKEAPFYVDDSDGHHIPWSKHVFNAVQSSKGVTFYPGTRSALIRALSAMTPWLGIYAKAEKDGNQALALYLLSNSLKDLETRIGRNDEMAAAFAKNAALKAPDGAQWAFRLEAGQLSLKRIKEA